MQSRVASPGTMGRRIYARRAISWSRGPLAGLFRRPPHIGDRLAMSALRAHSSYSPSTTPCIASHPASSNCHHQIFHCQRISPRSSCLRGRRASPGHASSLSRSPRCTLHHPASAPRPARAARPQTTGPHTLPRSHGCTCLSREPCHSTIRLRRGLRQHDRVSRNRKHDRACSSPRSGCHLATAEPRNHHEGTPAIRPCRFRHWVGSSGAALLSLRSWGCSPGEQTALLRTCWKPSYAATCHQEGSDRQSN